MADTETKMEVNGLPTKFESTSDQPAEAHIVSNITATMTNAGATPSTELKSVANIPLESSHLEESAVPTRTPEEPVMQSEVRENGTNLINGEQPALPAQLDVETPVNGHSVSSLPGAPLDSSMAESIVPSSMPGETQSSTVIVESTQDQPVPITGAPIIAASVSEIPMLETLVTESIAVPEQQPTSDLRTAPHSDALVPEAVALIEERKHEEDSAADLVPAVVKATPPPASISESILASTATASNDQMLTSIPSPPPAPEMSHATLPSEDTAPAKLESAPVSIANELSPAPAPTPAVPTAKQIDTEMVDAPAPKTTRGREDDDTSEPAAKRAKKEDSTSAQQAEFKMPEPPSATSDASTTQPVNGSQHEGDGSITAPRLSHMKKVISNLKKSSASLAFRTPVDYIALKIPNYPEIVKQPMDLSKIDQKLKNEQYDNIQDFIHDFELIVQNCVTFNGKDHGVTQSALKMQSSFNNQMQNLPPSNHVEPSKAEKKVMKLKTEPMRAAPPRRQSVTTPGTAKSPKSAVTATTPSFAPGPDGMPLIRRDSSIVDGRPKRAIVPPKRNSDFAGVRPKKKKYELQLRFCQEVLKEIASTKHWQLNQYFTHPVDPVSLNIPTYFQVIKKPMDLGTIQTKLDNNQYEKAKDFEEDVRLVFKNCYKFNPEGDYVRGVGQQLEELFDRKWSQKDDWIAAREPQSEPASEGEDDEEDDDASDDGDGDSEDDRNDKIKQLQAQIEAMSKQMGELTQPKKKKKSPPVTKKSGKPKVKKDKPSSTFPNLVKTQEKKKKSVAKPKVTKDRYVTFAEKQYISNGIGLLPERQMQEALRIITQSVPSLVNGDGGEIELDIEEVPNHVLLKLLTFVEKYAGPPPEEPKPKSESFSAATAPTKSKKNKPMSKHEQEAQIEELKGKLGAYGGPVSPDALQSVEGNESSDDSADSEESEEE